MNSEKIRIEPCTLASITGFHHVLDLVAKERLYLTILEAPTLEEVEKFVLARLDGGGVQFVAVENETIVGWCDITRRQIQGIDHCGRLGIGLLKQWRGQGIGANLLQAAIDAAWQLGLTRIELEVFGSNAPAIHLYKKLGFVVEGCKKHARILNGVTDDIVCMALLK